MHHARSNETPNGRKESYGNSTEDQSALAHLVTESIRAPMIKAVRIPEGIDDAKVRQRLYDDFNIEIGAGLGPLKGKIWRVGLMGHGARVENVELLARALRQLM